LQTRTDVRNVNGKVKHRAHSKCSKIFFIVDTSYQREAFMTNPLSLKNPRRCTSDAKRSKATQSKATQSKATQSKATQSKATQSDAERRRATQSDATWSGLLFSYRRKYSTETNDKSLNLTITTGAGVCHLGLLLSPPYLASLTVFILCLSKSPLYGDLIKGSA